MLNHKLLAALGIAGALMLGVTADASANPWRGGRPVFRGPVYRGPVYRAPVYPMPVYAPVYRAPVVYSPAYAPVYQAPVYAPVYGGVGWRHHGWVRAHGHRW